jgi:hypothetical protein
MGIKPGDRFPARSADALPATLYGHFTQAIYRNRPIPVARRNQAVREHANLGGAATLSIREYCVSRKTKLVNK